MSMCDGRGLCWFVKSLALLFSELQWLTTTFAMIGKIGASAGFSMVYQYSAELFPTVVRNAGMGSSSCIARVGGMIAPYIADLVR